MSLQADPTVSFEKYHGTSNDFVIVDADEFVPNRYAFATTYCDREGGVGVDLDIGPDGHIGADGVLFLALEEKYSPPRVIMTLVQPDGSTAAMCGNGARCAAAWAAERTGASEVMVDTQAGTRHATVDGADITIEMGVPSFEPRDVPLARDEPLVDEDVEGLRVTAVNTGVPHAVAFVDDVDDVDLEAVAPPVRHADVFPEGANVNVASVGEDGIRQRTFERGVEGETQSCGTGAVAIVAAAKRLGLVDANEPVTVSPPGGDLEITVPDDAPATLRGPVAHEFAGELARDPSADQ
ncbi:diaminopimelate epimerase [Halogranum gelatinilyticum]|uniref:Diaminopimelate epimerase n=1 Tax=Halogranum gelatinilyticum TaxID=660521 RepID=A0A1G9QW98_9EURY|nr:diaminopimelate epimerase [Halogranum gelatinilyticum]SDM15223.1 diaminopimelate epimerase [Halogranum gelatinilyticum]